MHDHHIAGNEFSTIKRNIESMLALGDISESNVYKIKLSYHFCSKNHALVSDAIWKKIQPRYEEEVSTNTLFSNSSHNVPLDENEEIIDELKT